VDVVLEICPHICWYFSSLNELQVHYIPPHRFDDMSHSPPTPPFSYILVLGIPTLACFFLAGPPGAIVCGSIASLAVGYFSASSLMYVLFYSCVQIYNTQRTLSYLAFQVLPVTASSTKPTNLGIFHSVHRRHCSSS
jgi:hypothetical protein